jgi:hypothetical protein
MFAEGGLSTTSSEDESSGPDDVAEGRALACGLDPSEDSVSGLEESEGDPCVQPSPAAIAPDRIHVPITAPVRSPRRVDPLPADRLPLPVRAAVPCKATVVIVRTSYAVMHSCRHRQPSKKRASFLSLRCRALGQASRPNRHCAGQTEPFSMAVPRTQVKVM